MKRIICIFTLFALSAIAVSVFAGSDYSPVKKSEITQATPAVQDIAPGAEFLKASPTVLVLNIAPETVYIVLAGIGAILCINHFVRRRNPKLAYYTGDPLTIDAIEREASKLSHFEGRGNMSFYTGEGDDLLSFEGDIRSFAQELDKNLEKQFTVSVVNANASTRTAEIFAGYYLGNATLAPGQLVEGAFNDINAAAGLTGATQEAKSIQELNLFLNACPTRLLAMKIQSTVAGQLNNNLTYQRLNPFKTEETLTIRPKNFINQDTYQNDQVTFPVDVQLDQLAKLRYPFAGSSTNYVTLYFGASVNLAQYLEKKASKAKSNIEAVGVGKVLSASKGSRLQLGS
jgi:hypothetical protein